MTRGYKNKAILFSIFAIILLVVGGIYLNFQTSFRNSYLALKNGQTALATATPLDAQAPFTRYSYTFTVDGKTYTSTTVLTYTPEQMESITRTTNGFLSVKYVEKDSKVELVDTKANENGHFVAISCETNYFNYSTTPGTGASVGIFCLAGIFLLIVAVYLGKISWINSIARTGVFAYAVFVEAYSARFGSNRYMAVRYSYMDDNENWVEDVTPYAYSPSNVEMLKNLEAIAIRYKGRHSVIVENFRAGRL